MAAVPDRRSHVRAVAALIWGGAADADGGGLLLRGQEYQPAQRSGFDPLVLDGLLRLARLADWAADGMHDCPDQLVRRSAAVVAARAHPVRAAFDG